MERLWFIGLRMTVNITRWTGDPVISLPWVRKPAWPRARPALCFVRADRSPKTAAVGQRSGMARSYFISRKPVQGRTARTV